MPLTRIDSAFLDLDAIGGIDFDVQSGVPTLSVDATTHRVGIGTDTPAYLAHIHNPGTGDGDHSYLHFTTGDTGATGSDGLTVGVGANQTAYINYREAGTLSLSTSGTQKLNITSSGNLQVKGGNLHLDSNAELALFEDNTSGTYTNSAKIALDFSGNVARIRSSTNGSATIRPIALYTGNDVRLYIATDGNVGVGTNNPIAKLHVNGTALFDSTVQLGAWADNSDSAIYMANQANSGQIVVKGDGTSTASAFSVYSGGYSGATDEVAAIKADGSVQFAGGNGVTTNQSFGIDQYGRVSIREDASNPADVFSIYKGSSSTKTVSISNNGGATFSGNVGVGENSPDVRLHVKEQFDTAYSLTSVTSDYNHLLKLENPSTTANAFAGMQFRVGSGADLYFGAIQQSINHGDFFFANQNSPQREMMRIKSSGEVGIGTDNPQRKLVVSDNGTEGLEFFPGDGVNGSTINVYNRATAAFTPFSLNAQDYRFSPNGGTEAVRITSTSNVGVGTDSPGTKLHVVGDLTLQNANANGNTWTYYKNASRTYLVGLRGSSNNALSFYDLTTGTDTERMRISPNGAVGINTTADTRQLEIYNSSHATAAIKGDVQSSLFFSDSDDTNIGQISYMHTGTPNNYMYFRVNDAERLRITSSGNVGIGTDSLAAINSGPFSGQTPKVEIRLGGVSNSYTRLVNISNPGAQSGNETLGRVGIKFSLGSEGSSGESNKSGIIYAESTSAYNNGTSLCFATNNTERLRITSGGIVNIGDATPNASGSGVFNAYSSTSGALSQFVHAAGNGGLRIGGTGPGSAANLVFSNDYNNNAWTDEYTIRLDGSNDSLNFLNGGTSATPVVTFASNGNVGIGESSPNRKLYITGSETTAYQSTGGSNNAYVRIHNKNGTDNTGVGHQAGLEMYVGTGATTVGMLTMVRTGNNVGDFTYKTRTGANSYAEHFRIQGAGRVGIGTDDGRFGQSTPISTYVPKLGVQGSIIIGNLSTTASDRRELQFYRRNGAAGQPIDTHDMGRVAWYGSNNDSDNASLAWSIGVTPDGGTWTSGSNRKGFLTFNNHNGEQLRIASTGNVGINTTNPSHKLTVYNSITTDNESLFTTQEKSGSNASGYSATGIQIRGAARTSSGNDHTTYINMSTRAPSLNGAHGCGSYITLTSPLSQGTYGTGQIDFYIRNSVAYSFPNDPSVNPNYWMSSLFTIQSNGNIGIGTTTPSSKFDINTGSADGTVARLYNDEVGVIFGAFGTGSSLPREATINGTRFDSGSSPFLRVAGQGGIKFCADLNNERLRIRTDGHVASGGSLVASANYGDVESFYSNKEGCGMYRNNAYASCGAHIEVGADATDGWANLYLNRYWSSGEDERMIDFRLSNSVKGTITSNTSGTTYNTTSDIRLKTDIKPISDATDKLMNMNPVTHKWKEDPDGDTVHGFIAQEMQNIAPEAVHGEPDGEMMMGMDYGRITPIIVAALQNAIEEINTLKQRILDLEN